MQKCQLNEDNHARGAKTPTVPQKTKCKEVTIAAQFPLYLWQYHAALQGLDPDVDLLRAGGLEMHYPLLARQTIEPMRKRRVKKTNSNFPIERDYVIGKVVFTDFKNRDYRYVPNAIVSILRYQMATALITWVELYCKLKPPNAAGRYPIAQAMRMFVQNYHIDDADMGYIKKMYYQYRTRQHRRGGLVHKNALPV